MKIKNDNLSYEGVKYIVEYSDADSLRYACIVKPYGPFVEDPAGGVTEIKLINPKDYKQYFDWGEIGERIIERAIDLR